MYLCGSFKGHSPKRGQFSGPGFEGLLGYNRLQNLLRPFMMSYMSAETTVEKRLEETRQFVAILSKRRGEFLASFAVQRNYSCPNVGATPRPEGEFLDEVTHDLIILGRLNVPIVVKLSVTTPKKWPAALPNARNVTACWFPTPSRGAR